MKNREIFQRDPAVARLVNDGVAAVGEATTPKEIETLRYELEHFVCEGQYEDGLTRILESYLGSVDSATQPAAWVSGFYGSGKSHLLKMFRHLWVDTCFESDGATARGLARLPQDVRDLLKELDTFGRRCGGLHAASGTLPSGGGESVRLAVLGIILRSAGLPESLPQAQFCLWLQKNGILDRVKDAVTTAGRDFREELHDLYVSPLLAKALLEADPTFAPDLKQARMALRAQFPVLEDVPTSDFIRIIRDVLTRDGQIPSTVIVLDEIQLFIGGSATRSTDVQEVAEALCKQLDSRVLLIGAGQIALAGSDPLLQRMIGRFTIPIELSDTDVETVTRRVVLAKQADRRKVIEEVLASHAGEIDRQLSGTRIAARSADRAVMVDDYPLLPVRRRFWEHTLRAVDVPGTSSQLRTQLRIVYDSVRELADEELGNVVPGDFIFDQLQPGLLRSGVLLREIDETIRNLDDGTLEGRFAKRVCGLVFLIRKLPREEVADIGVRATPATLADLLVSNLANDGTRLRKELPPVLNQLVEKGILIKLDDEYSLQTRESSEWDREFRSRRTRFSSDLTTLASKHAALITDGCAGVLRSIKLLQGACKEPRKLTAHFGPEPPASTGREIPVWIRDGWGESEATVLGDARAAGHDSPIIYVHIPKSSAEDLKKAILEYEAAKATLGFKGTPTSPEGLEARDAMATRMAAAEAARDQIITEVIDRGKVIQGGGNERFELKLVEKIRAAAEASLDRLFPDFKDADDERWPAVIRRARSGDESALQAVDWDQPAVNHPVCAVVRNEVGSGRRGKEIRDALETSPYGWPRDAVDAALLTLFTAGQLLATHKGAALKAGQLDQAKISVTDFRVESIIVTTPERIKLRKLFDSLDVTCSPNEESSKAGEFLARLADLADRAGGEAPLPVRPKIEHIETLRALAGNEQLGEILSEHDALSEQVASWTKLADLAAKRMPAWAQLVRLIDHATTLPEADDLRRQAESVKAERRLLEAADLLPEIRKQAVSALRRAVKAEHGEFARIFAAQMTALTGSETWKNLSAEQQKELLDSEGIVEVPPLSIGDEAELLRSLEETSLPTWKTKTDALPQQFAKAAVAAARLLEPKVQRVHLDSTTLKTEADVKRWLAQTESELVSKLRDGPIVIA
jgi:hypothetical protein